jgi:sirohydrochlorin ferrochelatase
MRRSAGRRRPARPRRPVGSRPKRAALLLIGHGSRVPSANRLLREVARGLRGVFPGRAVEIAYLEAAPPDIREGIERCVSRGATRILIVPYFLYLGGHVGRDLPRAAVAARRRHEGLEVRIAAHLGRDRRLLEIVADRSRRGLRACRWS